MLCGTLPANVEKSKTYSFECEAVGDFVKIVPGNNDGELTFTNLEVYSGYQQNLSDDIDNNAMRELLVEYLDEDGDLPDHLLINDFYPEFSNGMSGFAINSRDIYFWNQYKIWSLKIDTINPMATMNVLALRVDRSEKTTKIKKVRTGSTTNKIAIIVRYSGTSDCFVTWDVDNNTEIECFDQEINPKIFWDQDGHVYSTQKDMVYFSDQGIRLKCYDVKEINEEMMNKNETKTKITKAFDTYQGHKFDAKGHSWLYLQGFISLSYSYMTFVMNRKLDEKGRKYNEWDNKLFDVEKYNYLINRRSPLSTDTLINNYNKLSYVLKMFEKTDPVLLDMLQYYYLTT